jgi:hypothetical protein
LLVQELTISAKLLHSFHSILVAPVPLGASNSEPFIHSSKLFTRILPLLYSHSAKILQTLDNKTKIKINIFLIIFKGYKLKLDTSLTSHQAANIKNIQTIA